MASYQSIEAADALPRGFTLVARASGAPITAGTVNYYLQSLTGANAGKWWRDSDGTWQVAETANAMTHVADGHWKRALSASPWADGIAYLEYAKESGDLHVPVSRALKGEYSPSADSSRRVDLGKILGTALTETVAGYLAAAFKKLFDVAVPVLTTASVNQTGDNFVRVGANGAGLTALGDTRLANLDATVSSRLASGSYTAPPSVAALALEASVQAVKLKTDNLPAAPAAVGSAMTLSSGERNSLATALLDLADGVEDGYTLREAARIILASAAGILSGADTDTVTIRDVNDTTDRIVATTDATGRTAVVIDAS